jgi:hypothetical protein
MNQIEALIDKIAAEYGVPGWVARAVAYGENSSFDPNTIAPDPTPSMPNAVSVGLFQIHDVNTPDRAQRQNAEWNIRWAMQNSVGPAYRDAVAKGITDPSELLTYIWTNGQRAAASAIPGAVQRAMSYVGGEATPTGGTEGGITMAGATKTKTFWEYLAELGLVTEPSDTTLSNGEVVHDPGGELRPGVTSDMVNQMYAQWLGTGADTGTMTTTTTTPSAQEAAIGQWDIDKWLYDAEEEAKTKGLDYAVQNFVNKLNAAQEGRLEATAAQEYAMNLAPPGMTEYKIPGWSQGIPLGAAVPNTYAKMMELQGQNIPQVPDLQYQPGALPQMPPAGLPTTSTSTQIQTPISQGALPAANAGGDTTSHMQAIKNYIQRMGGMLGSAVTGGNLPVGGR